ncbi:IS5/IS1182 family transposase [Pseudovibrio sp. WM33]|uniref:IS5/IS1182 family transposase n=1 Tax=Pseudovibrio sp. WM33 TaxID=1735585 RepID=UPI0007AEB656|nr:IS5/IS1182 family transposase [Pseudovibrio sp. WM33]KZL22343.1 hypothetical protein PsWM33_03941 [Pseudovibrio sp. WM33]
MPFKQTADRRHKFDKAQFKVTNWSDYNASLRRRGDITVWIDEDVTEAWVAPVSTRPGRAATYSDLAIEICLRVKSVFSLALRQTQGFVRSVFALLDLTLPVPDYSTVSRRTAGLNLTQVRSDKTAGPASLVISF